MHRRTPTTRTALTALACLLAAAAPAAAQYYPGYPGYGGYRPPAYGPGGAGYGAGQYYQGAATLINATGELANQNEQARIMREKATQEKLVTRKKSFDLLAYEKANTPSWTEEQEKTQAIRLRRVMNDPLPAEVSSGKAMNTMLPYMSRLAAGGTSGPPVPLSQDLVRHLNLTVPDGHNPGLLRSTKLDWPLALRGPEQEVIDVLYTQAVIQAADNKLDPVTFGKLKKEFNKLNPIVIEKLGNNELDGTAYLASKRFITALDEALSVLQQPNAARFVGGQYAAKGNTVQELVQHMAGNGLQFAPASPGDENFYRALHTAMVSYAAGASDGDNTFRMRVATNSQQAGGPPKK